jgi:hypothetical protein
MEIILKIEEIGIKENNPMAGYAITTDKQVIKLLIDDYQDCCENYGYFMSEDDIQSFVGSELLDIGITDTALNSQKMKSNDLKDEPPYVYEGDIMFVNISTTAGMLQFVAYNEHNGYYGHDAKVISEQLNYEVTL